MKLCVKFPTRQRPEQFFTTLGSYYQMLSGKHDYQFVITLDSDDSTMNTPRVRELLDKQHNLHYHYGNSKTKIQAVNADLEGQEFDIIMVASDDMIPQVPGFDDIIITKMQEHFPNLDGCLHFNDGRQGKRLNTLSILGVNLYKHFGYIYHPSYESVYCDNEFMDVTEAMGKAVYIDQVIIAHKWIDICGGKKDELYLRNDKPNNKDKKNYHARKAAGFP